MFSDPGSRAPGWDAISARVETFYSPAQLVHRAMHPGLGLGSPLQGISAYSGHGWWLFVTYGLSELFAKESRDPARSGWGYELTLRAPITESPPEWPFGVLVSLAQLVQSGQMAFGPGHRLQTGHPIAGLPTRLTAIAFTLDPELGTIQTPNGALDFLLAVGITDEELARMRAATTAAVLAELETAARLITDPGRAPA